MQKKHPDWTKAFLFDISMEKNFIKSLIIVKYKLYNF